MFRDDLKAARARAEQLQRDLAKAEERAESSEEELRALRERVAKQERELKKLREHNGSDTVVQAPQDGRLVKLVVLMGLLALGATIGLVLLLRRPPPPPHAPTIVLGSNPAAKATPKATLEAPPGPTIVLDKGATAFRAFALSVAERCRVSSSGYVSDCKPKDLLARLRGQAEGVGTRAALLSYCSLLWAPKAEHRRLAAYQLATLAHRSLEAVGEQGFRCLDHFVRHGKRERGTAKVAKTWVIVGGAGHLAAVVAALDGLDRERRLAALRGLWKGGRLAALPHISRVLAAGERASAEAVLAGLGYEQWTEAERDKVCPLLAKTAQAQDRRLAARAVYRLAGRQCVETYAERAYALIAKEVAAGPDLDFWWVAALGQFCARYRPASPVCPKALGLLERMVASREHTDLRRAQALDGLRRVDHARARKVARALGSKHAYTLGRAVERALKVEK